MGLHRVPPHPLAVTYFHFRLAPCQSQNRIIAFPNQHRFSKSLCVPVQTSQHWITRASVDGMRTRNLRSVPHPQCFALSCRLVVEMSSTLRTPLVPDDIFKRIASCSLRFVNVTHNPQRKSPYCPLAVVVSPPPTHTVASSWCLHHLRAAACCPRTQWSAGGMCTVDEGPGLALKNNWRAAAHSPVPPKSRNVFELFDLQEGAVFRTSFGHHVLFLRALLSHSWACHLDQNTTLPKQRVELAVFLVCGCYFHVMQHAVPPSLEVTALLSSSFFS